MEGHRVSDVVFRSVFVSESCCVCSSVAVVWGQQSEWRRPVWVGDVGLRLASPTAAVLLAPVGEEGEILHEVDTKACRRLRNWAGLWLGGGI